VHSAKTGRTGMSTPLSQFTILDDAEPIVPSRNKEARKEDIARHRDHTLDRVNRERRNREPTSRSDRTPFMPVIPEMTGGSQSDINMGSSPNHRSDPVGRPRSPNTAAMNLGGQTPRMVPRTPSSALPTLPVTLDKSYPPPVGPPDDLIIIPSGSSPPAQNSGLPWESAPSNELTYGGVGVR
jgi:hypothetical protein